MDTNPTCPSCGKPLDANAPKGLCPECLMKGAFPTGTDANTPPRFIPPSIAELAAKFPQLEILRLIGQGGMGAVYQVRQKQLDRIVALKILPPQTAEGPGFAERFTREARALAKLNHPHIVTLYEFGQADGLFYFLMEFVDGVNLRQLLNSGRVAPKEALAIVPQICEALQFAHERGIVHRDIKPENILLGRDGNVKIADFGVAKIVGQRLDASAAMAPGSASDLTESGATVGTPQYMAPEQTKNSADVDPRADIYSLGVVFYQMLTGELPSAKIEPPSKKVVIDVRLDEVVLRALEREPELRYQKVSQVKHEVETIAATIGKPAVAPAALTIDSRFSRKAIIGAVWAPFFFATFLLMFSPHIVQGEYHGPTPLELVLRFTLLPMGRAAPFGTTILGWIAVAQIRRSAGKIYGLGLAVFDGLLFPLLILDVFVWVVVASVVREPIINANQQYTDLVTSACVATAFILMLVLDFFIIRAVWRTLNRPSFVSTIPSTAEQPPRSSNSPSPLAWFAWILAALSGIIGAITAIIYFSHVIPPSLLVLSIPVVAVPGIILGFLGRKHNLARQAMGIGMANLAIWLVILVVCQFINPPPPTTNLVFGPPRERTLAIGNHTNSFFCLQRAAYVSGPSDFDPQDTSESASRQLWKWLTDNDADLFVQRNNGRPVLAMSDMVIAVIDAKDFGRLGPEEIMNYPGLRNNLAANNRPSVQAILGGAYGGPVAAIFQTRYGVEGMLRVESVNSDPPGITFRYKLVHDGSSVDHTARSPSQAAQPNLPPAQDGLSFGPIHRVLLDGSGRNTFLNLDNELVFPDYSSDPSGLDGWMRKTGVNLAFGKTSTGDDVSVRSHNMFVVQTNQNAWSATTAQQLLDSLPDDSEDPTNRPPSRYLLGESAYLFMTHQFSIGILRLEAVPANPQAVRVLFKTIQAPVEFGPVVERVMNLSGHEKRAVNLVSGKYIPLPPGAALKYTQSGNAALATAGIDVFSVDTSGDTAPITDDATPIVALNMSSWDDSNHEEKDVPPDSPNPWARIEDFPPLVWWITSHAFSKLDTNTPDNLVMAAIVEADKFRRAKGHEDPVTGSNICVFTTRGGVSGILQAAPIDSQSVKLRYRLLQTISAR